MKVFLTFLLDDGRIRIREAQKLSDSTDPDSQRCLQLKQLHPNPDPAKTLSRIERGSGFATLIRIISKFLLNSARILCIKKDHLASKPVRSLDAQWSETVENVVGETKGHSLWNLSHNTPHSLDSP